MKNIGFDFGTTYSVVAMLDNEKRDAKGKLKSYEIDTFIPGESSTPFQASLVVKRKDGTLETGEMARAQIGRAKTTVYKGFKMMLAEKDPAILASRGYGDDITPKKIVEIFIQNLLSKVVEDGEKIDKLVVGVPEIWFSDTSTIDSRTALEDIINQFDFIERVELVSEPACACAFFTDNYKRTTNNNFRGRILIVDYGGGTLDLALCDVHADGQRSEVSVLKRCGAGLNEEGFIGKAGMAYIEKVVKLALEPMGIEEQELIGKPFFQQCVCDVETALISKTTEIGDVYEMYQALNSDRESLDELFFTLESNDGETEYPITYGMLAKAYQQIIYPVLEEKMAEMKEYIVRNNINTDGDVFKIAPVGGFCNFYLTRKQIEEFWGVAAGDRRFQDIITDRRDCEKAISYGAALIANDVIGFKQTVPYHLGIFVNKDKYWAFHLGDDIKEGEPSFVHYETKDKEPVIFKGSGIENFAICFAEAYTGNELGWPQEEMREDVRERLGLDKNKFYKLGFSFDKSMTISLHKCAIDIKHPEVILEEKVERLRDVNALFNGIYTIGKLKK